MINDLVLLAKTINRVMDALGRLGIMSSDARSRGVTLPGYANGITNAPGGWAMVGERGPELMYVPSGANIQPMNTSGSQSGAVYNLYNPVFQVNENDTLDGLLRSMNVSTVGA